MVDATGGPVPGLEILNDPCQGCGACCEYVGVPPGYYLAYEPSGDNPSWVDSRDAKLWRSMPADLRQTLDIYFQSVSEGLIEDRELQADPCIWYDQVTRRCSHHEWRPEACRAFEAGGDDCLGVRDYAGR